MILEFEPGDKVENPTNKVISKMSGFPKSLSYMWGKSDSSSIEDCSIHDNDPTSCNDESSCNYDDTNSKCENSRNYDAVFTYRSPSFLGFTLKLVTLAGPLNTSLPSHCT